jgi:hypothetical protein
VIGVNDQTLLGRDHLAKGLSFAIPGDTVRLPYLEIVETGNIYVIRASLGALTTLRSFSFASSSMSLATSMLRSSGV